MELEAGQEVVKADLELRKMLKESGESLDRGRAKSLVRLYLQVQHFRTMSANMSTAKRGHHQIAEHFRKQFEHLEKQAAYALKKFADAHELGSLVQEVVGVGPVLAAGLLAHIDIEEAPYAGHIWSYAGLNPSVKWERGQPRPWNEELKNLCFKIGESFVKCAHLDDCEYGHLFHIYKAEEWRRNMEGMFSATATEKVQTLDKSTEAYKWCSGAYNPNLLPIDEFLEAELPKRAKMLNAAKAEFGDGVPMLSPAHIHARARRWVVKLFLSHYHYAAYKLHWGREPHKPYVLEHCNGHHMRYWPDWLRPIAPAEEYL